MIKTYDDVLSFSKANLDAIVLASTTFAAGVEEVTKEVLGYAGKSFETAVETVKASTSCKTPVEIIQVQQKFAKDSLESLVAEVSKLNEMGTVIARSAAEPIQVRCKSAFDTFSRQA